MTTPTFRDWAVMFGKCIQGHGPREFERSKPLARYILSRIERKEKALREELQRAIDHDRQPYPTAEGYEKVCTALNGRDAKFQAERSRIAERVRAEGNHCPDCPDAGCYATSDRNGDAIQTQCEWCETMKGSAFRMNHLADDIKEGKV